MKITIQGTPGEGKTTVALLIADALAHAGIDVAVEDPDVQDLGLALSNPMLAANAAALRTKEGFNVVVRTEQERRDLAEHVRHHVALVKAYARALRLEFNDRAKLVDDWGAEEWEGVECAAFAGSGIPSGDVVVLVEQDGTIKARTHCADPDNFMDEDKFSSVLESEIERATKRCRKLHAE